MLEERRLKLEEDKFEFEKFKQIKLIKNETQSNDDYE